MDQLHMTQVSSGDAMMLSIEQRRDDGEDGHGVLNVESRSASRPPLYNNIGVVVQRVVDL